MSKFREIKQKMEASELTLDDLRSYNVDPEDLRKLRIGEGITHRRAMKDGPKASGDRTFRYVMSTENAVGFFRDVVKVNGWDLDDFKKREQPFLFGHNVAENRPPLGRMDKVKKDKMPYGRVLAGDAEFTPEGLSEFNDMVHDMVENGFMPGGSVGFNVLSARKPTDREMKSIPNVNEFSSIIERAQLVEFSAVPVGMDPDAVKMRAASSDGVEAFLRRAIEEGRYDRELVAEFRHEYLGQEIEARNFWTGFSEESADPVTRGEDESDNATEADVEGTSASTSPSEIERLTAAVERLESINEHLEKRIAQLEGLSRGEKDTGDVARNDSPDLFDLYLEAF